MNLIAYDLGTGGVKASLYDGNLNTLAKSFVEYETFYPGINMHEQKLSHWWEAVVSSTKNLVEKSQIDPKEVACIALSGHSLVAVPVDENCNPLIEQVPIWSDTRAEKEAEEFFEKIDYEKWYMTTGNGFPAPCYSIFKLMWLKKHMPDVYEKTYKVVGSKDFINMKLTGKIYMDYSYASGTGAYDLRAKCMRKEFLEAAGLSTEIFPEIIQSHSVVGSIKEEIAEEIGLCKGTLVACGGVDNACMALGAVGPEEGKVYTSLGSSSWIPVNSSKPVLDPVKKPYVFAHIQEDMFTSAFSIFAGGSSFRWSKEVVCSEMIDNPRVYDVMADMAKKSPIGANNIFFNPSLAGGTSQDKSVNVRGAYIGLHLGTTRNDMVRAVMEGIALNLKNSVEYLKEKTEMKDEILVCGGGSKSAFWLQMFADVFDMNIVKTNIDQDAASLGAVAIAARAVGMWKDYSLIPSLHCVEKVSIPDKNNSKLYDRLSKKFNYISNTLADLGDYLMKDNEVK